MPTDPLKAKCWECKRRYDRVAEELGGVIGYCYACDSKRWIIAPSEAKKMKSKKRRKA